MHKLIEEILQLEAINLEDYYIAILDATRSKTIKAFLKEMGKAFKFPSYYGQNLNALKECLNDLEWLNKNNFILVIKNSGDFLKRESSETKADIVNFLSRVTKEWANVPNYEGEDLYRSKGDFRVKWL